MVKNWEGSLIKAGSLSELFKFLDQIGETLPITKSRSKTIENKKIYVLSLIFENLKLMPDCIYD